MLYYFKKGKNATEMQEKICTVYGGGAVTDGMCQKWFAKLFGTIDILANSLVILAYWHSLVLLTFWP